MQGAGLSAVGEMVSSGRMIVNSACTVLFDNRTKN
jgi:hypothetical protein